ncbi:Prolyl 3-hydroxylase 3 [Anabarilius grahami]|uniref:procollagen-proline 3-dioxygenase n=1 Tax=Anabarilius grahami TaxID=495550 RepID=A0A3N0XIJ5_ANAGA|nr:Prolyl 3-hydroxylase 3 [Anabarilius grahami]
MVLHSNTVPVYVASLFILNCVFITAGSGLSSESSSGLLAPHDELYYRGVRAYFREDWERAAEFLEKSISTRDMLLRTRRKCHDECLTAGDDKVSKLDTEDATLWDLGILDWIQVQAECVRFCVGRSVSPAALLPVSSDIEYEFGTRNPYNYLQVTYYRLDKMDKAASAAHTFFVANPSHLEMRNNIEKYRRMIRVKDESFQDREREQEQHWEIYDAAVLAESSSDWVKAVKKWKECVNETIKQTEECRAQCEMAPRVLPEEPENAHGVYERAAAGDLKGAVKTLRSLLLFYPTDSDSLNNMELYSQTLEGDTEAQETGPMPDLWTPEDVVPESLRETWRAEKEQLHEKLKQGQKVEEVDDSGFYAGGPIPVVGVTITMDDQGLNGTNRAVLDGVLSQSECDRMMQLATVAASVGDGYRGRRSPHTPHEKFEGLTVLRALKLSQDGLVKQSDAKLLHEIGETVKVLMDSYFRSHSHLYFAYTHLVCRSAIPGQQEGRSDLSHPVHVDNCILEPETRQCWREAPAFTHRDLSAVLYLNDNFEGGDFFFTDRDTKTVTAKVKPSCGRLVGFTSGPVNPHGVTAVTKGRRCALALWFTTEKPHRDMEREEAEALWAADGQIVVKEEKVDTEKSARSGRSQGKERSKERERVTGRRDEL